MCVPRRTDTDVFHWLSLCEIAYEDEATPFESPVPGFPFAEGVAQLANWPFEGLVVNVPDPATIMNPLDGQVGCASRERFSRSKEKCFFPRRE